MSELKFEIKNNPTSEEQKIIRDGIIGFNQSIINDKPNCFNIFLSKTKISLVGQLFTSIRMRYIVPAVETSGFCSKIV